MMGQAENEINLLREAVIQKRAEADRAQRRKDRLDQELKELKQSVEAHQRELSER